MSDTDTSNRTGGRRPLSLNRDTGTVKQSFSHGRSKQVVVETKRKRVVMAPGSPGAASKAPAAAPNKEAAPNAITKAKPAPPKRRTASQNTPRTEPGRKSGGRPATSGLSEEELRARQTALAQRKSEESRRRVQAEQDQAAFNLRETEAKRLASESKARSESREDAEKTAKTPAPPTEDATPTRREKPAQNRPRGRNAPMDSTAAPEAEIPMAAPNAPRGKKARNNENQANETRQRPRSEPKRRRGKLTIAAALGEDEDRQRSLASVRRARERERERRTHQDKTEAREKVSREITIPETITLQDLALRMSERVSELIKFMMSQDEIVRGADILDADTAELIVTEFGHRAKRVSESDVEIGLDGSEDDPADLQERPPVVTVMGHVDHGKTSLLDAMRSSDVAAGEAGGITQHIGAWQIENASGHLITFIDTPGHAAFSAMRVRGANATDIVVLVVAADDGVMPQTIEAISHAKSAEVPIIVAINKCDVEGADPNRVLTDLLQHDVQVESLGGDVQAVEVSALKKTGLETLSEAISLQAELLELKANPNREASGTIIESRIDKGRGPLASLLVQRGTITRGDIVVAGAQWGKVRALTDARGQTIKHAKPGQPIEILGLAGVPEPGQSFVVVKSEPRAREITEYRSRLARNKALAPAPRVSLEQVMAGLNEGGPSTPESASFLIKADMQGSVEAIAQSIEKISGDEVTVRIVHGAAGGVSESDVLLASTTGSPIIAFNVRAPAAVQQAAEKQGVEIRYYSIIYDVLDDVRAILSGMLAPEQREVFIGYAEILEIFDISKTGKVAGCTISEGIVKRGCGVRLLRDDVVIHAGELSTLRRFKNEVDQVENGLECGMAFKNYQDIHAGDRIECFTVEQIARTLD